MFTSSRRFWLPLLALLVIGCGGALGFGIASLDNVEEEFVVYASDGTPIGLPNAYALLQNRLAVSFGVPQNRPVRSDLTGDFDFVFNIDPSGTAVLLPTALLNFPSSAASGIQRATTSFEDITRAPLEGYATRDTAVVAEGDVLVLRSRRLLCLGLALFVYAKVELLELNMTDRSARFRILFNPSCGFRGLEPGIPPN